MPAKKGRFTRKQERLLNALLNATSISAAARAAGMCDRQARRLLDHPEFRVHYDRIRDESMALALEAAKRGYGEAIDTLREIAGDQKAAPSARVQAASKLADIGSAVTKEERDSQQHEQLVSMVAELKQKHECRPVLDARLLALAEARIEDGTEPE